VNLVTRIGNDFTIDVCDICQIRRYEVMINKQLNQAIAQLERLQAMRKAESVPGLTREESSAAEPIAKQSQEVLCF